MPKKCWRTLFKECWGVVTAIAGAIVVIGALFAWDARYAKSAEVKETFQQMQQSIQRSMDIQQLRYLNDRLMSLKGELRKNPRDNEAKEDYQSIKNEKEKLEQEMRKK